MRSVFALVIIWNVLFLIATLCRSMLAHFLKTTYASIQLWEECSLYESVSRWVLPNISHTSTCPLWEVYFHTLLWNLLKTSILLLFSWNNDIQLIKIAFMISRQHRRKKKKRIPPTSSLWLCLAECMSFAWGHNLINLSPAANGVEDMWTEHWKTTSRTNFDLNKDVRLSSL